jgi:hypothetical protein
MESATEDTGRFLANSRTITHGHDENGSLTSNPPEGHSANTPRRTSVITTTPPTA